MKKCVVGLLLMLLIGSTKVQAQAFEVQQLLLNVEKLAQLKNILSDLKRGYEILSNGYTSIKNISEGNFHLHDLFLDRLLQVSPVVKNYRRVSDIISTQVKIVKEYKAAFRGFSSSNLFNLEELTYVSQVYANLFDQSVKNLETLAIIVTSGKLRMSDDERLSAIDAIWKKMEEIMIFFRQFNNETKILALQRAKENAGTATLKKLYSINH